jgi:hypothetical protein
MPVSWTCNVVDPAERKSEIDDFAPFTFRMKRLSDNSLSLEGEGRGEGVSRYFSPPHLTSPPQGGEEFKGSDSLCIWIGALAL